MALKIRSSDKTVGFYESFSDLIFATMAIFILLMVIFLVLANEANPVRKAQRKLDNIEQSISDSESQIVKAQADAKSMAESVDDLAEKEVEIAIVVDKSASMEQELYNLKHAIRRLGDMLPKIMDKVSMSVVSYRISKGGIDQSELLSMRQIKKSKDDGGRSVKRLNTFLKRQRHLGGTAPVLAATHTAIGQFSSSNKFHGHQVLMILGDVGPYEINYNDVDKITAEGQRRAMELVRLVGKWAKGRKHRNLIVMFSGRDEINNFEFGEDRRIKHRSSMELFKKIASSSGQPDAYTENQASMFVDFLVAALKRK